MRKMKKKFIALLMIFTSIISFLPIGFSGQAAMADVSTEATQIRVNVGGDATPLVPRTDDTTKEAIYKSDEIQQHNGFDITMKDVRMNDKAIKEDALAKKVSVTDVVDQQLVILKVNEIELNKYNSDTKKYEKITGTDAYGNKKGYDLLNNLEITENDPKANENDSARIGRNLLGLPGGVNKIEFAVVISTKGATYTKTTENGQVNEDAVVDPDTDIKTYTAYQKEITIEHGNGYIQNKISEMVFKAYTGDSAAFQEKDGVDTVVGLDQKRNSNATNNSVPFLYVTTAKPDPNMYLRYNFDVPDSLSSLKYIMKFGDQLDISKGVDLVKNGKVAKPGTDYQISQTDKKLNGELKDLNQSDLIMIRIKPSDTTNPPICKTYAIELRYNQSASKKDFSLSEAGITKLEMNDRDDVQAYIGKIFNVDLDNGYPTYKGNIYIDPRAKKISLNPVLFRKQSVAYAVTNTADKTGDSELKDGKRYINFNVDGAITNTIQVLVYEGDSEKISDSSKILARYLLTVNLLGNSTFNMGLDFSGSTKDYPYLTQPGVAGQRLNFNEDRRTYDLYYYGGGTTNGGNVTVKLTGNNDNIKRYIKVYTADGVNSTNYVETESSINNTNRDSTLNVSIPGTAKKLAVQVYYDKYEDKLQEDGTTKSVLVGTYPIGEKYVFYLPQNYQASDNPTTDTTSNDASLSSLKINGYTLTDSDGNSGFSSNTLNYTTTVAKENTSEKVTATATDDNVKSIVATINGSDSTYDLTSGQVSELPLNSNGVTTITMVVTAQDGKTTKTYTLIIKNNTKGGNADLKNVFLSNGEFTFNPKEDVTKVRVDPSVNKINVTPIPEDSKAKTKVNGDEYSGTAIDVSLRGTQTTNIEIEVTSEDGTLSKTYTLEVSRVDAGAWDNNNSNNDDDKYDDDQYYDEYNDCWVDLTKYEQWGTVNGKPVYFDKHNRQVKDAWITTGDKMYYLNNVGYRASGWKIDTDDGKTYYLDAKTGEMRKGWINLSNNWYYLQPNGIMKTGWLSSNNKWYYFTPNGQMVVNQTMYIDGKTCSFGQDGALIS